MLAGLLLGLISLGMFLVSDSEEVLMEGVRDAIEEDFRKRVQEVGTESLTLMQEYHQGIDLSGKGGDPIVRLIFNDRCQLVQWSHPEIMPSAKFVHDLCGYPANRTIEDKGKTYYLQSHQKGRFKMITLLPISLTYKVDNTNLPPYVYLGRYQDRFGVDSYSDLFSVHLRRLEDGWSIYDGSENFVYCLSIPNPEVFDYAYRRLILSLALLGWTLFLAGFYFWGRKGIQIPVKGKAFKISRAYTLGALILLIIGGRLLMLELNLPGTYLSSKLFSPTLLAIDQYSPSLGDLALNVFFGLAALLLLLDLSRNSLNKGMEWLQKNPIVAWLSHFGFLSLVLVLIGWFFGLLLTIIQNSIIYFEYSDLFKLDIYSLVAFLVIGGILVGLQLIIFQFLRYCLAFIKKGNIRFFRLGITALFITGMAILFYEEGFWVITSTVSIFLSLLALRRSGKRWPVRLDLPNFLFLVLVFSLLTVVGTEEGLIDRRRMEMERIAERQADPHDLVTEALFERVVKEIEDETFFLQYNSSDIADWLKENFFESSFKGYDVRIFVYDSELNLFDRSSRDKPWMRPDSEPGLADRSNTMTENLHLVPYFEGIFESIYIGTFELLLRDLGEITVWAELFPNEIQPNRLFPQLLLDDNIRSKATTAQGYEYAVYRGNRLLRKYGDDPFPMLLTPIDGLEDNTFAFVKELNLLKLYYSSYSDKVVFVRAASLDLLSIANLFSFIFYFYVIGFLLLSLPLWISQIIKNPKLLRKLSLRSKIQVLFLFISVFPLVVVIFFMSPYIKDRIYQDLNKNLQSQTMRLANMLGDDYLNLRKAGSDFGEMARILKDRLSDVEKTLFNDINIYYSNGSLHLSTQPTIYELGLASEYMNPTVYQKIRGGEASDMVIEDKIGKVSFFSGYYPLMNKDRKIVGFLNIPYLKNQDQVNEQSQGLLTFLVNIYVFIFLAIGIIAVLLSNSILRPLNLLSDKLKATQLGQANDPIEWESSDEIGQIIESYNDMLEKLADSEKKLAQNERELAWKEMARQVAHEIKNPLTPMKLSVQHLIRSWKGNHPHIEKMFDKVTGTILVQIDSLVNIANSFSEFAKMPEPERSTFRLQDVVEEVGNLYGHSEEVHLKMDIPEEDFLVNSDREQLSRVFNNLVKNAIQAIGHEDGQIQMQMTIDGDQALIAVSDNGTGIPEEIRKKIFQPNFTTKTSGMGLGLAMVKKIVEVAGGRIYFESEIGVGTTFFVELPRAVENPT